MSAGQWLAATAAVLVAVLVGALGYALVSVTVTLRRLRRTAERIEADSAAVLAEMRQAVRDATFEVDRVDALVNAAEVVEERLDGASRLVSRTVTSPVVKIMALGTGTRRAVQRMRGEPPVRGRS